MLAERASDESEMSAAGIPSADSEPREGLAEQLRQLEAFVARAELEGEHLPREAMEMVARLREIIHALEGLTSSFDGLAAEVPKPPTSAQHPEQP